MPSRAHPHGVHKHYLQLGCLRTTRFFVIRLQNVRDACTGVLCTVRRSGPLMPSATLRAQDGTITRQDPGQSNHAADSLRELLSLSKKLAAVRGPPRVIGVQGATRSGLSSGVAGRTAFGGAQEADSAGATFSSASAAWQEQQVLNARLEKEWREGQGRAAKALACLLGSGSRGKFRRIILIVSDAVRTSSGGIPTNWATRWGRLPASSIRSHRIPCHVVAAKLCLEFCLLTRINATADTGSDAFELEHQENTAVRVARLRLPSDKHFRPFKAEEAVVPVVLGRPCLRRLQQALTV